MANSKFITENDVAEFCGQMVDIFEDYLTEKGIWLSNPERDEAIDRQEVDVKEAAIIFGSHYDYISVPAENIVHNFLDGNKNTLKEASLSIMNGFKDLVLNGNPDALSDISKKDLNMLGKKVTKTFQNWDISFSDTIQKSGNHSNLQASR